MIPGMRLNLFPATMETLVFRSAVMILFIATRTLDICAPLPTNPALVGRIRLIDGKRSDAFCRLTEYPAQSPLDFERSHERLGACVFFVRVMEF